LKKSPISLITQSLSGSQQELGDYAKKTFIGCPTCN